MGDQGGQDGLAGLLGDLWEDTSSVPSRPSDPDEAAGMGDDGGAHVQVMKQRKLNGKGAAYVTKVGIGNLGVDRDRAESLMGKFNYNKTCAFCNKAVHDTDELNPELTMAWHKPNFEGKAGHTIV